MYRYWLWLALMPKMSHADKLTMLELGGNPEDLYHGDARALSALSPNKKLWEPLLDKNLEPALAVAEKCQKLRIRLTPLNHPDFPKPLRVIPNPPLLLYSLGKMPDPEAVPLVAMVGTRKCTDYGLSISRELGAQLGAHGAGIVSGMAVGIDSAALEGALRAGAPVVGVLGCGLDVVFPKSSLALYRAVATRGCLLSEFPPGTAPISWHFPWRNRIISGLSGAVVVVEAPEKSGALITARDAMKQGREVYAVPGPLGNPACRGSNQLLQEGVQPVTRAWDILRSQVCRYPWLRENPESGSRSIPAWTPEKASGPKKPAPQKMPSPKKPEAAPAAAPEVIPGDLSPEERAVLASLAPENRHMDTVAARTGLSPSAVLSALTMLEIKGLVITQPGGWAKTAGNYQNH